MNAPNDSIRSLTGRFPGLQMGLIRGGGVGEIFIRPAHEPNAHEPMLFGSVKATAVRESDSVELRGPRCKKWETTSRPLLPPGCNQTYGAITVQSN